MFKLVVLSCLVAAAFAHATINAQLPLDGRLGGVDTTIEEFPYQVSLEFQGSHICGGAIISENYVLTTAHCALYATYHYTIRAGTADRGVDGNVYKIARIVTHAQYDSRTIDYDYALIQIRDSFDLGATQAIIALPEQDEDVTAYTLGVVTGWGSLREGATSPIVLQKVAVPIVDQDTCNNANSGGVTSRMICAGFVRESGTYACQGDSGGPLVVEGKLVGVVSWGYGCARGNPAVYSRVAAVRNWIAENSGV